MIISLDIAKIRYYLNCLRDAVSAGSLRLPSTSCFAADFAQWIEHASAIQTLPPDPAPERVVSLIQWALEAKGTYLASLKTAFSPQGQRWPRWINATLKLGRYAIASMALLQLAAEMPRLFNPMRIKALVAPGRTNFILKEGELPLTAVLRRSTGGHETDYISSLGRVWSVTDAEHYFRNACPQTLRVHAEMQLLNFYAENPDRRPTFRFIGVSKKSCFLCHRFLMCHPLCLSVSSCHQKLYPAWRPPPTASPSVYKKYKSITRGLSEAMEGIARGELGDRLGTHRPVPPDSSAGITISGLTDLLSQDSMVMETVAPRVSQAAPSQSIRVVDLTHADDEVSHEDSTKAPTTGPFHIAEMVFHVKRADDSGKQDIITLGDVWDNHSERPSWVKLLGLLKNDCGVAFKEETEYLMVNNRIKVMGERQFRACVQYLQNAMTWNSDVSVYSRSSCIEPSTK